MNSIKWVPRGLGTGEGNGVCAISGQPLKGMYGHDASGFVDSRQEGMALTNMFKGRAYLDYRSSEPRWIQVKVAVERTPENEDILDAFVQAVRENDNNITPEMLAAHFNI